jgi:hypothetical protein
MRTETSSTAISVEKIVRMDKGNLKAFAIVNVGGITIHDVRVIQQPGQDAWISGPQREWTDRDGNRKFSPIVQFDEDLKKQIQVVVLNEWGRR